MRALGRAQWLCTICTVADYWRYTVWALIDVDATIDRLLRHQAFVCRGVFSRFRVSSSFPPSHLAVEVSTPLRCVNVNTSGQTPAGGR